MGWISTDRCDSFIIYALWHRMLSLLANYLQKERSILDEELVLFIKFNH